jgi:pyridoxal phosphate enzyme (YggS family)
MRSIDDNLQAVRQRISDAALAAGRAARDVTLLAVSKTQPASAVEQALAAGQRAFGENYVQEALEKLAHFDGAALHPEWHLIGPLQSNKTRLVAERFDWVQSVESEKIARRLSEARPAGMPALNVLIQVNVSGEASKSGVAPGEVLSLAKEIAHFAAAQAARPDGDSGTGADVARYRELKPCTKN